VEEEDADVLLEQLNDELHLNLESILPQAVRTHAFNTPEALEKQFPSVPKTGGDPKPPPPPPSQPPPSVGVGVALDVSEELRMHINKLKANDERAV
jgi:hypothetical protein